MNSRSASYGDRNTPMRRPKEPTPTAVTTLSLLQKISSLNCDANDNEILSKCNDMFKSLAASNDSLEVVFQQMHTSCLIDDNLSRKVAKFIKYVIANGRMIFNHFLPLLQETFSGRERLVGTEKLRNAMVFHGEIYDTFTVDENIGLQILAQPLVTYMIMTLLSADIKDIELLLMQLVINSKKLEIQGGETYQEFIVSLHKSVLSNNNSKTVRTSLLLAIDICNGKFPLPKGPLRDFYSKELGDIYLRLESRVTGSPYIPTIEEKAPIVNKPKLNGSTAVEAKVPATVKKAADPPKVSETDKKVSPTPLPQVNDVRGRMRALGLLPRPGETQKTVFTTKSEKDDEFYGLQLPRVGSVVPNDNLKRALEAPLPSDEWE